MNAKNDLTLIPSTLSPKSVGLRSSKGFYRETATRLLLRPLPVQSLHAVDAMHLLPSDPRPPVGSSSNSSSSGGLCAVPGRRRVRRTAKVGLKCALQVDKRPAGLVQNPFFV